MYHRSLILAKKVSRSYQNQSINAIKFYLERVLKQERRYIDLERPKSTQPLPQVLGLKLGDVDSDGMRIWVREGKGVKDRLSVLSPKLLDLLRVYYKAYHPKKYLFEGPDGKVYSGSSVRKVLSRSVSKAGIKKTIKPHTLRHSFATHLLENGTNLRYIQTLLGHTSPKTTETYTHATTKKLNEVKSPLDFMD